MIPGKRYHMCQDVRGAIENWNKRDWKKALSWISRDDGTPFASVDELRDAMWAEIAKGHEVIPYGDCDNFDWQHGCQGHPILMEEPA